MTELEILDAVIGGKSFILKDSQNIRLNQLLG